MCGICGFWAPGVESALARAMSTLIAYRGPDGDGLWAHPTGVAFAHRRLAIIDVSPAGLQPMVSASGRFVITFNGEVYNFSAIRQELERAGLAPAWRGGSDTEVMLAAIEAWGLEAAVTRFIGMFAFALFDTTERVLHLVRDRAGVKPLFVTRTPAGVAFGSELKALRVFPGFDTTINHDVLAGYLAANCVAGQRSIFRGTEHVLPGTIISFNASGAAPRVTRYWDPREVVRDGLANPFGGTEAEAIDELDALLRDVVRLRMVSDVPLGAFLSGGVDSSTVVAMMQVQSNRPVRTFSIANETAAWDESSAARAVARHLNTHHTPFTVTAKDALDVIPLLPAMYDEPFADSSQIPTFLVSKLARRSVTVSLSGDGGDELFGGYTRHVWGPRIWNARRALPRAARTRLAASIAERSPIEWDALFRRAKGLVPETRIAGIRMHKVAAILDASSPQRMYEILSSHWLEQDGVLQAPATAPPPVLQPPPELASIADEMMFRDLVGYMVDDILTKVDRASMAVSLEAREPLVDHRLMAFSWRLPRRFKIRFNTGKWILRQVLARYVPADIISSPKAGFGVPLGDWLRGPLRDWAESYLAEDRLSREGLFNPGIVRARWTEHLNGRRPWEYHLWDIIMFQAWRDANNLS
jgi:asparagine synthase (glutamine-hydrolysing)